MFKQTNILNRNTASSITTYLSYSTLQIVQDEYFYCTFHNKYELCREYNYTRFIIGMIYVLLACVIPPASHYHSQTKTHEIKISLEDIVTVQRFTNTIFVIGMSLA